MNNSKISVFGGTGFIGSLFSNKYSEETIKIERNELSSKSENILYFISTTHNYNIFEDPHLDINTNLNHLIKVLEKNKSSASVFNFISSWFVYGDTDDLPAKEDSICRPKGFYSITKKCAEDLLISYCKTFNINYRILRLSNIYGKTDNKVSAKKNALQFLVQKIKNNEEINLYNNGNFLRDYLSVNDCCKAIKTCIDKGQINEIVNIGSGKGYMFKDIINEAIQLTNSSSKINNINSPEFHKIVQVADMYLDTTKLKNLGFHVERSPRQIAEDLI